jgi:hypothetical protein
MQNVMVDTTGALHAAGQRTVGLQLGLNGVLLLRKLVAIHRGVRPVLGRLGRGRLSGRPFCRLCSVRNSLSRPAPAHEAEPSEAERHHGPSRGLRNPRAKAELECILS